MMQKELTRSLYARTSLAPCAPRVLAHAPEAQLSHQYRISLAAQEMAENRLEDLVVYVDVRQSGKILGDDMVEVTAPGGDTRAAKKISLGRNIPEEQLEAVIKKYTEECRLMRTLSHANIVRFFGVCHLPDSQLPARIMEQLPTNLHYVLRPQTNPPHIPEPFFPLSLKCSILHDVARGLAYLHERSIAHWNLTAKNVLLNSDIVAKIGDLGVARLFPDMAAAIFTTETQVYMPREVFESSKLCAADINIDMFSFGVLAIFTVSESFPCHLPPPTYWEDGQQCEIGRSELERRKQYVDLVRWQLGEGHPLIQIIERCLEVPDKRPKVHEILHLLEDARKEVKEELNKLELFQALRQASISHKVTKGLLRIALFAGLNFRE